MPWVQLPPQHMQILQDTRRPPPTDSLQGSTTRWLPSTGGMLQLTLRLFSTSSLASTENTVSCRPRYKFRVHMRGVTMPPHRHMQTQQGKATHPQRLGSTTRSKEPHTAGTPQ